MSLLGAIFQVFIYIFKETTDKFLQLKKYKANIKKNLSCCHTNPK